MAKKTKKAVKSMDRSQQLAAAYGIKVPQLDDENTLSPNEIGRLLGVTGEAVKQWIYNRRLPASKFKNGYWRVKKSDLQRFLDARQESTKRKVILVSTDNTSMQLVAQALTELNCESLTASSSADALLKINDLHPALCIIDISQWPEGWELAHKVQTLRKHGTTPVLFISDEPLVSDQIDKAVELQIKGCLNKPLSVPQIKAEIDSVLTRTW